MEVSEEISVQPNSSELGFRGALSTTNGASDHEASDHRRSDDADNDVDVETKLGFSQPEISSNGDSDSEASDLALREQIASLVLKECEESAKLGALSEINHGSENVEERDEKSDEKKEDFVEKELSGEEDAGDRSESDDIGKEETVREIEVNENGGDEWTASFGARKHQFPVRPEAEDCAYYMKTGGCKFGGNCKFNHPVRRRTNNQAVKERIREKEKEKEREVSSERTSQSNCKFYLRSGGCKYGKSCKYNHPRAKATATVGSVLELNFLGLPIRAGEKECPFYMRTGSCKYGAHCRFNHPDPTDAGGSDNSPGYGNGGGSQSAKPNSWSSPRSIHEAPVPAPAPAPAPFVPLMVPPSPGAPSQNTEWNGYQAPPLCLPPERNIPPPPPAYTMNNNLPIETNIYKHHSSQPEVDEYPERPGQPDCTYFLKTGDCKYRSNCKYHHPKNRVSTTKPPCALSDKGLPLRPDQNICTHFGRYGICKFGPACKYDHSQVKLTSTLSGGGNNQPLYGHAATMEGAGMSRSGSRSEVTIQQ